MRIFIELIQKKQRLFKLLYLKQLTLLHVNANIYLCINFISIMQVHPAVRGGEKGIG